MLWSDDVLKENSHNMKRLWLVGTIVAGLCASRASGYPVVEDAVRMADEILAELEGGEEDTGTAWRGRE